MKELAAQKQYNLDLKMFYNELPKFNNIIEEVPMNRIKIVVDEIGLIIKNTEVHKDIIFDVSNVNIFIKLGVDIIYSDIKEIYEKY